MSNEPATPLVEISFTAEFKRNLRALTKRYRHVRADIEPVLERLQAGDFIGDQIPHTGHTLYKVRIRNSDARRGKRGGYRMIYYIRRPQDVVLITVYSKTEQADISAADVRRIIREFEEISE